MSGYSPTQAPVIAPTRPPNANPPSGHANHEGRTSRSEPPAMPQSAIPAENNTAPRKARTGDQEPSLRAKRRPRSTPSPALPSTPWRIGPGLQPAPLATPRPIPQDATAS